MMTVHVCPNLKVLQEFSASACLLPESSLLLLESLLL
jgi:hypothetical protein